MFGRTPDALLFNVFHTLWFRLLIALLTANIIVCSVNRWKGIWTTAFRTRVRMGDAFFQHTRFNASMTAQMPAAAASERVQRALSRARYRVQAQSDESSIALYADKHRLSRFGTFLSHLSLVLILAGTVIGGLWGFHDDAFIVAEGTTAAGVQGYRSSRGVTIVDVQGPPKDSAARS